MSEINLRVRASVAVLSVTLCGAAATFAQQIPATAPSQAAASSDAATAAGGKLPSALLQPGIEAVRAALAGVRLDKWKASEAVRDEADANLNSIRKDMDVTLPGLLATADGAPDSVVRVLPAYRNIEALYDVLLRVAAAARVAAPNQSGALDQAMLTMDAARRGLGDKLQVSAAATEKQVGDLRVALKAAQTPPPPPPAPVVAPVTPVKKKKPAAKPAAKTPPPAMN
jgi:hypothetical protein